jgi:NitT/TauT family transport system ATP-binding protein
MDVTEREPDSPRSDDILRLENISFGYPDGGAVLDEISLGLSAGSVVGLVGPSGCGKSTFLGIVAGLLKPDSGALSWNSQNLQSDRHRLSLMFQADTLLPWLNVENNVGLHYRLTANRTSRVEQKRRVSELIKLAHLTGSEKRYPYQLSGGMRRRVAFLASVAPKPQVLLLDEPFSSLDEPTRISIHEDVFKVIKRDKISTLLITHDLAEAISLSDQVIVLTNRPARVFTSFSIPFGEERNMFELRDDPKFLSLYGEIWEQLAYQIKAGQSLESP